MAKAKSTENTTPVADTTEVVEAPVAEETGTEESATRVGPMHQAFADFLNSGYDANITAEQIFLVTSKRKAFRSTPEYREGVRGALEAAKEAEAAEKAKRAEEREAARAAKAAEKEAKAAERKAEAEKRAEEKAAAKAAKDAEKAAAAEAKAAADAAKAAEKPVVTKAATEAPVAEGEATPKPRAKGKTKAAAF